MNFLLLPLISIFQLVRSSNPEPACSIYFANVIKNNSLIKTLSNNSISYNNVLYRGDNHYTIGNTSYLCDCLPNNDICIRKCCADDEVLMEKSKTDDTSECVKINKSKSLNLKRDQLNDDLLLKYDRRRIESLEDYGFKIVKNQYCPLGKFLLRPDEWPDDRFILRNDASLFVIETEVIYKPERYCLDWYGESFEKVAAMVCLVPDEIVNRANIEERVFAIAMLISVLFMIPTFLVYAIIKELRNLYGQTLMCYVASLAVAYCFLACVKVWYLAPGICWLVGMLRGSFPIVDEQRNECNEINSLHSNDSSLCDFAINKLCMSLDFDFPPDAQSGSSHTNFVVQDSTSTIRENESDSHVHDGIISETTESEELPSTIDPLLNKNKTYKESLLKFLQSDPDGKLVFTYHHVHQSLNKETRGILTRTIIKNFKNEALKQVQPGEKLPRFNISSKTFIRLSKAIEEIFPGEIASTYYTPYQSENGLKVPISGTLWSNYTYTIVTLRKNHLLSSPKTKKKEIIPSDIPILDAQVQDALERLKSLSDKETIPNDWRITFNARKVLLNDERISVADYIERFPCLRIGDAKKLFEIDFDLLHPGKQKFLYNRWPTIKDTLRAQLQSIDSKIKNIDDKAYIKLLPALDSESEDVVIFYLLQLLIGVHHIGKRKKGEPPLKFSPADIRESFMFRVEKVEDLKEGIKNLKRKFLEKNETFQPCIAIVGPLTKILEVHVVVDEHKYQVKNILDGVDLAFKVFFALDCKYPIASSKLWQFIQLVGFNIIIPGEPVIKSIKELSGVINLAMAKARM